MYIYHLSTIHLSVEGHLGCSNFLAIVNRAAMNLIKQVCVEYDVESLRQMPRSDLAGVD